MEVLPEYESLYGFDVLPSYRSPTKRFCIKSKVSFHLGTHNCNWNVCEKETDLVWYKLYPEMRGIRLKEADKQELVQLIESPSKDKEVKHYNFIVNGENSVEILMEMIYKNKEFSYSVDIIYSTPKGQDKHKYVIKKRPSRRMSGIWCLYDPDFPRDVIAKFTLSLSTQRIADISFFGVIPPFEFHIFLAAISQCLFQLYHNYSHGAY